MTANRLTAIVALAALLAWLWRVASRPRATIPAQDRDRERDEILLDMSEGAAYQLGYAQGINGHPGYWPEQAAAGFDYVPGVGIVLRETDEELAYWKGWHLGDDERDRANA